MEHVKYRMAMITDEIFENIYFFVTLILVFIKL